MSVVVATINVLRYWRPALQEAQGVETNDLDTDIWYNDADDVDVRNMTPTSIEISPRFIDFGEVKSDTVLVASFIVKNIGEETLFLQNLRADCICTSSEWNKRVATPGDSLIITLKLDTKGKSGDNRVYATFLANTKEINHKLRLSVRVLE